jgi:hypothetical protein
MDESAAGVPNRSEEAPPYVFLSYNSEDEKAVVEIAAALRHQGIEVWLDRWSMRAGDTWRNRLEDGLGRAASCVVFLGPHGPGPWQDGEITLAIQRQRDEAKAFSDRGFRLIPVLLPGTPVDSRPDFLNIYQAVTFRTIDDREALDRLASGIRDPAPEEGIQPVPRGECPYKGLEIFDVADAPRFFGRAVQVRELLDRLRDSGEGRFLAIVGSSGSGKSSLARAGVLAALQGGALGGSAAWPPPVIVRPQSEPLRRLALALAPRFGYRDADVDYLVEKMKREPAALRQAIDLGLAAAPQDHKLPVLADQLEEAFTLCEDEPQRRAFVENLCDAGLHPESRIIVLVTLRSDFYGRCADYPELRRALGGHCLLGALSQKELCEAVAEPARRAGWKVDDAVLALLWDDFERQPPGGLPLLQYALWEMWNRAPEPRLTAELYSEIGGIEGALERRADEVFLRFSPGDREICRRVLLRLTEPREEDFRRDPLG